MKTIRQQAEDAIGPGHLRTLEKHGLTVIPKTLMDWFINLQDEDVLFLEGRPLLVSPASPNDVERVGLRLRRRDHDGEESGQE